MMYTGAKTYKYLRAVIVVVIMTSYDKVTLLFRHHSSSVSVDDANS